MPISSLSKIGVAVEASWGAGGSPAVIFPLDNWSLTGPYEQVLDNARRGVLAKDFNAYQGIHRAEASMDGPFFPDLIGYLLRAVFGSVASAGTPGTHTFTFSGSPPSLAMTEELIVRQHQGKGLMASEFGLSFSPTEGILGWSASMIGRELGTVSHVFPAETQVTTPFIRGWQGSASIGGVAFPLIEGDLTISREVALQYRLENSQLPGTAYADAPEITGSFSIDFTTGTADYDRYRNHTQGSIQLYWELGTAGKFTLELGSVDFGDGPAELDHSGAAITLGYTWRSLYVPALSGPARAILVCNTLAF